MSANEATSDWPLADLEPEILGLRATIGILGHLIQSPNEVDRAEWCKVEDELNAHVKRIEALWDQAWERDNAKDAAHKTQIAALKAEVAEADEPLSGARLQRLETLNGMLRGMAKVITNTLDGRSVSILKGLVEGMKEEEIALKAATSIVAEPKTKPEPSPERMRW
jgi:hypothetical protein